MIDMIDFELMVSHNGEEMTFGNGENVQTELVKFHFKIEDGMTSPSFI